MIGNWGGGGAPINFAEDYMSKKLMISLVAAGLTAPLGVSVPVMAQGALEEIVVTAQRRVENLQDVPLAVSALSASEIEGRFGNDLSQIGNIAPNIILDPTLGNGTASVYMRGLGLNDVEKSFDPAVGVFLDGVYLATTTGALLNVFDAESVEVLRGPQGTLFGRNTIGGVIHLKRKKPTGELGGNISAVIDENDRFDVNGVLNLGSYGNVSGKISFVSLSGGGYFSDPRGQGNHGDSDMFMVSPQIRYQDDRLDVTLTYDYIDDNTPTRPVTNISDAHPTSDEDFHSTSDSQIHQAAGMEIDALTLNATYELDENSKLVAVIGTRETDEFANQDFDGTFTTLFRTYRPQQAEQTSYELRYHREMDNYKLVLGAYLFESEYHIQQNAWLLGAAVGAPAEPEVMIPGYSHDEEAESTSFFGQLDYNVMEDLTISIGGRYVEDEKTSCGGSGMPVNGVYTDLARWGACENSPVYVAGNTGRADWDKFMSRFGITKDMGDTMVYASYTEGFRSGGFNGRSDSVEAFGPYDPEEVDSIEIGLKTRLLDNRLEANFAVFSTDYKDKQQDIIIPSTSATATSTFVANAASATVEGFEAEIKYLVQDNWLVGMDIGLLDAKFDNYIDPNGGGFGTGIPFDKSGFEFVRAPELTFNLNTSYTVERGADRLIFAADYSYKDDYYIGATTISYWNNNPALVDAYGILNASMTYETDNMSISFFGKNLTDDRYFTHVLEIVNYGSDANGAAVLADPNTAPFLTFGTISPSRTFGLRMKVDF